MNCNQIIQHLQGLPLSEIRCFDVLDSTNSEASRWIDHDAPDLALVLTDKQIKGKGRLGREWFTPPGAALAFSLVLRQLDATAIDLEPEDTLAMKMMRLTGLGAVTVCEALESKLGLSAKIKWPNDILLKGQKTAGILVETIWQGAHPTASILGIGINVAPGSVPPDEMARFPATCVEHALGKPVDRIKLLRAVLESVVFWRNQLSGSAFIQAWDDRLAYKGDWVDILNDPGTGQVVIQQGILVGLDNLGRLKLLDDLGYEFFLSNGELSLRAKNR